MATLFESELLSEMMVWACDLPRLTAAKEDGATIEIDGKKVALGIPGGKSAATGGGSGGSVPGIPLGRGGTPDDAAGSILLYVYSSACDPRKLENTYLPSVCSQFGFTACIVRLRAYSRGDGWTRHLITSRCCISPT